MSETPKVGARIIKIMPKVYWAGVIEEIEEFGGETYYNVRFDDPSFDDEALLRDDFIMEPEGKLYTRDEVIEILGRIQSSICGQASQYRDALGRTPGYLIKDTFAKEKKKL